jgi:hypothetical protein
MYSERGLGKYIREMKLGDKSEEKGGHMVGIAQSIQQPVIGLTARVGFSGISSFSLVLFSYVLMFSNFVYSVLLLRSL